MTSRKSIDYRNIKVKLNSLVCSFAGALFLLAAVFTLLANNWRIESHDGQTEANEPDLEIAVEIVKRKSIVVKNEHINKSVLSLANEHAHLSLMTDEDKTGDFDVS